LRIIIENEKVFEVSLSLIVYVAVVVVVVVAVVVVVVVVVVVDVFQRRRSVEKKNLVASTTCNVDVKNFVDKINRRCKGVVHK
jgi:hypothetical protein